MLTICLLSALALLVYLRRSPVHLVWRTRWLMLVLILGYAYSLPGAALLPSLGPYSPSDEGAWHGLRHAVGLLTLLLWLDALVLVLPARDLLGGLYQLARPFAVFGLDGGRFALRLGLTLKAIENLERGRGNLVRLLDRDVPLDVPDRILIQTTPLRVGDFSVPGVLLLALASLWAGVWSMP